MINKISPSDLKQIAQDLIHEGKMPSPQELLGTVSQVRKKYARRILAARHGVENPKSSAGLSALSGEKE